LLSRSQLHQGRSRGTAHALVNELPTHVRLTVSNRDHKTGGASEILCLSFRFVPRVIAIIWPTKDVTARAHPICLAELLGAGLLIVMRRAQTGEPLERRKCLKSRALLPAALGNRDSVVDNFRSRDFPRLQAGFATRMLC
jgi:hypothetical protein